MTSKRRPTERVRLPPPVIRTRLPSGRGATEQPNVTDDGAALTPMFWATLVLTGAATGLIGAALMALLFEVEHLAFDFRTGDLQSAVERASGARRVGSLLIAGAFGGVAWYVLRRVTKGRKSEIDDVLWSGSNDLSFRRSLGTGVISEIVIGMGASLGREAAPKLMGGVAGGLLGRRLGLDPAQQRLLIACGGGAGLACVYNVPLGGALFTVEILLGTVSIATVLPALVCSGVATVTAWVYLPDQATYLDVPDHHLSASLLVWALPAGLLIGVIAAGYVRLIGLISHHRITGWAAVPAPVVAFGILGVVGLAYPQLFGNGKDMAHDAFLGQGSIGLLLALAVLKPAVTLLCLGSGASGGLFTPVMSTGAVLGAGLGLTWNLLWPGTPVGAFAMVAAAAMIGAAMQAPAAGLVLVVELTHAGFGILVAMIIATALATVVVRVLDGYSIYSGPAPRDQHTGPVIDDPTVPDRLRTWERRTEWPLAGAAVLFLVAYAWAVLEPDLSPGLDLTLNLVDYATWAVFGVDYVVRVTLAHPRGRYVLHNLPDLLILVLPILRPLRLLRLVFLLKVLNRQATNSLRGRVIAYVLSGSVLILFSAALAVLSAERGRRGANINTFGDALWWAMTTITTVGYGDRYPVTTQGRFVAAGLMIAGIALLGVVTASLASWLVDRVREDQADAEAATHRDIEQLRLEIARLTAAVTTAQDAPDPAS